MKNWTINHTTNGLEIEKRLLCQPLTFKPRTTANGVIVAVTGEAGVPRLLDVLADVTLEKIFAKVAFPHMKDMGYTEAFIDGYLSRELFSQITQLPWRQHILDKIQKELTVDGDDVFWDLDAFCHFQTRNEQEWIQTFLDLCDEEIKEQLVHLSLEPLFEMEELPEALPEKDMTVTRVAIVKDPDLILLINGEAEWTGDEIRDAFDGFFMQPAYHKDSILYQEYTEIVLLVLLAKLYGIKEYTCESEREQAQLAHYLTQYALKTEVVWHDRLRD